MASNAVYLDLTLPVGGKKELPHPFYSYISLSNLQEAFWKTLENRK